MFRFLKSFNEVSSKVIPESLNIINPYTNDVLHRIPVQSKEEIIKKIQDSKNKLKLFQKTSLSERLKMFEKVLEAVYKVFVS